MKLSKGFTKALAYADGELIANGSGARISLQFFSGPVPTEEQWNAITNKRSSTNSIDLSDWASVYESALVGYMPMQMTTRSSVSGDRATIPLSFMNNGSSSSYVKLKDGTPTWAMLISHTYSVTQGSTSLAVTFKDLIQIAYLIEIGDADNIKDWTRLGTGEFDPQIAIQDLTYKIAQ